MIRRFTLDFPLWLFLAVILSILILCKVVNCSWWVVGALFGMHVLAFLPELIEIWRE